jgi:hypothetical protein
VRWFVTVGAMVLVIVGASAGGRVIDAAGKSCLEGEVRRVLLRTELSGAPEELGSQSVARAADTASGFLGFEVRPPCPSPQSKFVVNALLIQTYVDPKFNPQPYAMWSMVPPSSIQPDGRSHTDRTVQVAQYGSATPEPANAEPTSLGIEESAAFLEHRISFEPPGSDLASGEALTLYVYANGGTFIASAYSPPGELPDEGKIVAMLKQMIR